MYVFLFLTVFLETHDCRLTQFRFGQRWALLRVTMILRRDHRTSSRTLVNGFVVSQRTFTLTRAFLNCSKQLSGHYVGHYITNIDYMNGRKESTQRECRLCRSTNKSERKMLQHQTVTLETECGGNTIPRHVSNKPKVTQGVAIQNFTFDVFTTVRKLMNM
jgi:hypothetical protein